LTLDLFPEKREKEMRIALGLPAGISDGPGAACWDLPTPGCGSREVGEPAGGRGHRYVAALAAKPKTQRHAQTANQAGARYTTAAQSEECQGESNALLGWVGGGGAVVIGRNFGWLKTRRAGRWDLISRCCVGVVRGPCPLARSAMHAPYFFNGFQTALT
jgi:hypothetical protein